MEYLKKEKVKYSNMSISDSGKLFFYQEKVYRGYCGAAAQEAIELIDSGLINKLVDMGLFVQTKVSDDLLEGYDCLLEHELITPTVYPKEWTFTMLKNAALLVLEISKVAKEFNYKMADCHPYNIIYHKSTPKYVDFGTFKKTKEKNNAIECLGEYMRCYVYPLKIWRSIGSYLGLNVVPRVGLHIPPSTYYKIRYPIIRFFSSRLIDKIIFIFQSLATLRYRDVSKIGNRKLVNSLNFFRAFGFEYLFSFYADTDRLKKSIESLKEISNSSQWKNYHNKFSSLKPGDDVRFSYIKKRISELAPKSVLEIAGNQGVFSTYISDVVERVVCTDYDANALDIGYKLGVNSNSNVSWAVLDPFTYQESTAELDCAARFKSDAVIALALTHHLILSQHLSPSRIIEVFAKFTDKYIFVEFMPLGLFNGKFSPPIPPHYNLNNFLIAFSEYFNLIETTELEQNRILIIGSKK